MRIIPAIDIIEGKCIRLTNGDFNQVKLYHDEPLEVAKKFSDHGVEHLHLVDLDGAKSGKVVHYKLLEKIATQTTLKIDFGGGVTSNEEINKVFDHGAHQITGGSIAVKNPQLFCDWIEGFGADKIILGADCKERKIATDGWINTQQIDVLDYILQFKEKGITQVICTDIAKDGMLAGPSTQLYKDILAHTDVKLIASGGVTSIDDLYLLQAIGCEGAIIGKAIYENKISLKDLSNFMERTR